MRLVRLVFVLAFACAAQVGWAQQTDSGRDYFGQEVAATNVVTIYPNPATEYVHIKIEQLPAERIELTVHNIIGNPMEVEKEVTDEHIIRVKVKDLAAGYYLIAIKDEESQFRGTYKFLKR